jgi:hypothetical protein
MAFVSMTCGIRAITELAGQSLSDQTIMSIAGHVNRQMLNRYSHIRLDAKRKALQALETLRSLSVTAQSTSQNVKPAEAGLEATDSKWDQQGSNL